MELLIAFEQHLQERDSSPQTIRGYRQDVHQFFSWLGTGHPLEHFTSETIRRYRDELVEAGAKPNTINRHLAALAAFGHWAAQSGLIARNPAANLRGLENVALAPRWLTKSQQTRLLNVIEKDLALARQKYPRLWVIRLRDAVMVQLLLNTGLRVSELCALKLTDLQLSERKGLLTVRSGKGKKQRQVPLNHKARQSLAEWLATRPGETERLFSGQRGEPVTPRIVQRVVERYSELAGLPELTPHVLRHTLAKNLLESGVTMEKVATLLGHKTLNSTLRYLTPGEEDLVEAVALLDE